MLSAALGLRKAGFSKVHLLVYPADKAAIPMRKERETLAAPELPETPDLIRSEIHFSKLTNSRAVRKTQLSVREILDYRRLHPLGTVRDSVFDAKLRVRLPPCIAMVPTVA